jgi:hypothetical protein
VTRLDESAGSVYGALVLAELGSEWDRKESIEQRGIAVIQTSGILVGLIFGFASVAAATRGSAPEPQVLGLLTAALALFVLSGWFALQSNWPREYLGVQTDDLERLTQEDLWTAAASVGARRVAEVRVAVLRRARIENAVKAEALRNAIIFEVLAMVAAGLAVLVLVSAAKPGP